MTLTQLAALLDQLKLPIDEAPRDGHTILGIFKYGNVDLIWWDKHMEDWEPHSPQLGSPTHFLPLPLAWPLEFEVVLSCGVLRMKQK